MAVKQTKFKPKYAAFFNSTQPQLSGIAPENAKGNTQLKYLVASVLLTGKPFDKGAQPFQDFATLLRLRNDIMHLKPSDTLIQAEPGKMPTIGIPKYIAALQHRGLAKTPAPTSLGMSWFNVIQTEAMATWACDSAAAIMKTVLLWAVAKTDERSQLRMMFTTMPIDERVPTG